MKIKQIYKSYSNKNHKHFKRTITASEDGFSMIIQIGNRDHIHDFQPRVFNGVNLFDKYHNRQSVEAESLIWEAFNLSCDETVNGRRS